MGEMGVKTVRTDKTNRIKTSKTIKIVTDNDKYPIGPNRLNRPNPP